MPSSIAIILAATSCFGTMKVTPLMRSLCAASDSLLAVELLAMNPLAERRIAVAFAEGYCKVQTERCTAKQLC